MTPIVEEYVTTLDSTIKDWVSESYTSKMTFEQELDIVQKSMDELVLSSSELGKNVNGFEDLVAAFSADMLADMTVLQDDYSILNSSVSTLQGNYSTLNSSVSSLQGNYSTLNSSVSSLLSDYDLLSSDVATCMAEYATEPMYDYKKATPMF